MWRTINLFLKREDILYSTPYSPVMYEAPNSPSLLLCKLQFFFFFLALQLGRGSPVTTDSSHRIWPGWSIIKPSGCLSRLYSSSPTQRPTGLPFFFSFLFLFNQSINQSSFCGQGHDKVTSGTGDLEGKCRRLLGMVHKSSIQYR
jgi:hypothetical protein